MDQRNDIIACEDGLLKEEERTRSLAETRPFFLFVLDVLSAFKVFGCHLITPESLFAAILTAAATAFAYFKSMKIDSFSGSMDFILLAFTVVLPLSATIRFAFSRREQALNSIAKFKSAATNIYVCHSTWNWGKKPTGIRNTSNKNFLEHCDQTLSCLVDIGDALARFLTLPTASLPRHRVLSKGREEAARTVMFGTQLVSDKILSNMMKLSFLLEDLKLEGLTPSETSRARQWENYMMNAIEDLRMVKVYRTPQALRSFVTVSTILLPPFYSPAFAQIARDTNSLAVGIMFAIVASLALSGLHECVRALEDPFVTHLTLDGVDVSEELTFLHWQSLCTAHGVAFPESREAHVPEKTKKQAGFERRSRFTKHRSNRLSSSVESKRPEKSDMEEIATSDELTLSDDSGAAAEKLSNGNETLEVPAGVDCETDTKTARSATDGVFEKKEAVFSSNGIRFEFLEQGRGIHAAELIGQDAHSAMVVRCGTCDGRECSSSKQPTTHSYDHHPQFVRNKSEGRSGQTRSMNRTTGLSKRQSTYFNYLPSEKH